MVLAQHQTLTGKEAEELDVHLETCEGCNELALHDTDDADWRWVARLPDDALDDPDSLALPVVDPIVFTAGKQIAAGGMGKITRARDRRLGRDVAIKEMLESDMRARFEREAMITSRLQHPAIVPIYEAGTWPNGGAFYTMRLVEGGTLAAAIDKATDLPARLALLPHVIAVTEALAYAHSRRIIHRDLKPHNVLVGEFGEAVVIDWGLAKELDRPDVGGGVTTKHPMMTMAGAVIGTPCFMAPEQARGDEIDERADVFALGAILYNVLAGQPPYWDGKRDTADQLLEAVLTRPPTPIDKHVPEAPADLRAVVDRAMQREPEARYSTAKEMAEELRRFAAGQLLVSREYRISDLLFRWIGRHKAIVTVTAIAAIAVAVVGVVALRNVTRSRDAAEAAQHESGRSLAALLEEQGRSELVSGHRERAFAYLAEAYRRGQDTPALRHMLAAATREMDLLQTTIAGKDYQNIAFMPDRRLAIWKIGLDKDSRVDIVDKGVVAKHIELGTATYAEFSPNGKWLVATVDNAATAWNLETGAKAWQVAGEVTTIEFDPSSTYVALLPRAAGAAVYDVATGTKKLDIAAKYAVDTIAFDDGGGVLVAIGDEGAATFFTKEHDQDIYNVIPFERGSWVLDDAAFVGERAEDRVLMTTKDREVLLFTLAQPFRSIGGHRAKITAIAAAPRHRLFASADASGNVKLWGYDGALLGETNDAKQAVRGLTFSHDGAMLVGFGDDRDVYVWNVALGLRGLLTGGEFQSTQAVAIADDDSQLATLDESGSVRLWRPPVANLVAQHPGVALAVGGSVAVMTEGSQLSVVDLATGKVKNQFAVAHAPPKRSVGLQDLDRARLVVSGTRALVFDHRGAAVYELNGELVRELASDPTNTGSATTWELTPHYAVEFGDTVLRVHELATGKIVVTTPKDMAGRSGEIAPDESRIVVAQSTLHAWALPSGAPVAMPEIDVGAKKIQRPHGAITVSMDPSDLVFSPDGKRMIVLGLSTPVIVGAGTSVKLELGVENQNIETARWSSDGQRIITEVADSAAVWNAETGALLFTIPDVAPRAVAVADGRYASGSNDGTIRIWDGTGKLLEQIHGHRAAIVALAFSRDGSRLIAQGEDDQTTIWDVHLEQRSPEQISKLATPWKVVGGTLVRR